MYVANGESLADAVAAGVLNDGPVLLVPPCGAAPDPVRHAARAMSYYDSRIANVLGGPAAVCDATAVDVAAA